MNRTGRLTENQKACLRLVAQGMTSKEISSRVGLSPSTVDTYLKAATGIMGAVNRRDAARRFLDDEAPPHGSGQSQGLGYQTQAVVDPTVPPDEGSVSAEEGWPAPVPTETSGLLTPPPIGGAENELTGTERIVEVVRIAVLMAVVMAGLVLFAVGAIKVLS